MEGVEDLFQDVERVFGIGIERRLDKVAPRLCYEGQTLRMEV